MMMFVVVFILLWAPSFLPSTAPAGGPAAGPIDETAALVEANRLLEEELKLAVRPRIYMVVDLGGRVIVIKSRGMELHRLPIADWRQTGGSPPSGVFRLRARPPVTRPKAAPVDDATVTAIELQHMPDRYDLAFDPGLILSVGPPLRARPWPWLTQCAYEWYRRVAEALGLFRDADSPAVRVHVILTQETAQSLAWMLTDGMPLIVGRTSLP